MRQHESQVRRARCCLAQIAWVVVVAFVLLMYVAASLVSYSQLRQVCTAAVEQCAESGFATPTGMAQLAARGLSLEVFALGYRSAGIRLSFPTDPDRARTPDLRSQAQRTDCAPGFFLLY